MKCMCADMYKHGIDEHSYRKKAYVPHKTTEDYAHKYIRANMQL